MKKYLLIILCLLFQISFAQQNAEKVWNLLLENKRDEARSLFDKNFGVKKTQDFELLFLDALIDSEQGKIHFNDDFTKNLVNLKIDKNLIYPVIFYNFVLGEDIEIDDYTSKKVDILYNEPLYQNEMGVAGTKAIIERLKRNSDLSNQIIDKIHNISQWQYCGVFENLNGSGLDIEYEPENYAKNDKLFDANSNGKIGWYNSKNNAKELFHTTYNEDEYGEGILYAQSFVESPIDQEVIIELGNNQNTKLFLNDVELITTNSGVYEETGSYRVKVHLPKGMNRLLVKTETGSYKSGFGVRIIDTNENYVSNLTYDAQYHDYNHSTTEQLQPIPLAFGYEIFLKDKIKKEPNKVFYKLLLTNGLLLNKQFEQAKLILDDLANQYPKSSLICSIFSKFYDKTGERQQKDEINKTIETNDPDYYIILANKITDQKWITSTPISDIEEYKTRLETTKLDEAKNMTDILLMARRGNISSIATYADRILEQSNNSLSYALILPIFYDIVDPSKIKSQTLLEDMFAKYRHPSLGNSLMLRYQQKGDTQKTEQLHKEFIEAYPNQNAYKSAYTEYLIKSNKYDEALKQTNDGLDNFPYSFQLLKQKGIIYSNLKNDKEAEKYLEASLVHNSADETTFNILNSIRKKHDEIEENIGAKDLSKIAKERRNTKNKGELGVTTLYDEYIINVHAEGGSKTRASIIYEITSEAGIEELKEYDLGYGRNMLQSDVLKKNGSIVPGEDNEEGQIVFTNLEVGDIVMIQYESTESNSGRFYKDFDEVSYLSNYYPVEESTFTVITPKESTYNVNINNATIKPVVKEIEGKTYTTWAMKNIAPMPSYESYSYSFQDRSISVRASSIKSWKDIADWYADLVKKVMINDKVTKETFSKIFPQGTNGLSEEERAAKIYQYIADNINYSSVDFRQSGHVPQKPSKTISSKLGDCKDVSTLFMMLAQQAGLKANLVLVSTSDNPKNDLSLPAMNFNHCMVKTVLEGQEVYLELTDKNLPFKSLPMGDYKAQSLLIDFNDNTNTSLQTIPYNKGTVNKVNALSEIVIDENGKTSDVTLSYTGSLKSDFKDLLSDNYSDDERKSDMEDYFNNLTNKVASINDIHAVSGNDLTQNPLVFKFKQNYAEKLQKVGSLKVSAIPFITVEYTKDLIALENRKTTLNYSMYEDQNEYEEQAIVKIPMGSKFVEIPENKTLQYKGHQYSITYESVDDNTLKITKKTKIDLADITPEDYAAFKKYAEEVIQSNEQIIGFKAK